MPKSWTYYIKALHLSIDDLICDGYKILMVNDFNFISWLKDKDCVVIFLNDDGCIAIPDESSLRYISENRSAGVVYMDDVNNAISYSSERSRTPDQYLATFFVHSSLVPFLFHGTIKLDRWFPHVAMLYALLNKIDVYGFSSFSFFLPTLKCTSGLFISKTRETSLLVLHLIQHAFFESVFGADLLVSSSKVEEILINSNGSFNQCEKKYIDAHLSILTQVLMAKLFVIESEKHCPNVHLDGKRVVIVKVESIGDVIVALPLIESIFNSKASSVKLITSAIMEPLFVKEKLSVIPLPAYLKDAVYTPSPYEDFDNYLKLYGHLFSDVDVVIFPRYFTDRSFFRYMAAIKGIPYRVGINNFEAQEGGYWNPRFDKLLTHDVNVKYEQHEMDKISYLSTVLNVNIGSNISIIDDECLVCESLISSKKYIVIGLGASSNNRCWPVYNYNLLVEKLLKEFSDFYFVFIGGLDVFHNPVLIHDRVINNVGKLDISQSFSLLKNAKLYIGNDSGAMHLAALANIPVVEISVHPVTAKPYHVNSPFRFGPKNVKNIIFRPLIPAAIECSNGCIVDAPHCIKAIEVNDVYVNTLKFIKSL